MLSIHLFALYSGTVLAATVGVRQADLASTVQALEKYLAAADSTCVSGCQATRDRCYEACLGTPGAAEDIGLEVRLKSLYLQYQTQGLQYQICVDKCKTDGATCKSKVCYKFVCDPLLCRLVLSCCSVPIQSCLSSSVEWI